ncbi:hypothetical protein SAY87_017292 [Trapa incisa]|uniref:Uncharacterized protein n=1 Tax=Trapa incisa TaxID=236973 RepID=A0AAN7QYA9_9MYRT|nr:hypothetical protein SAY87_017292 [Trapa incisa]
MLYRSCKVILCLRYSTLMALFKDMMYWAATGFGRMDRGAKAPPPWSSVYPDVNMQKLSGSPNSSKFTIKGSPEFCGIVT